MRAKYFIQTGHERVARCTQQQTLTSKIALHYVKFISMFTWGNYALPLLISLKESPSATELQLNEVTY